MAIDINDLPPGIRKRILDADPQLKRQAEEAKEASRPQIQAAIDSAKAFIAEHGENPILLAAIAASEAFLKEEITYEDLDEAMKKATKKR